MKAAAVSLQFGPLKGQVTGTNRGKQFLARALSGVGTVAAFAVGRPGGSSLSGPMDNSILLRERVAQNIGIAGEQELTSLAYSQDVVVTVPGNTRFYIVLQSTAGQAARPAVTPASSAPRSQLAQPTSDQLPSAAELRELIALKQELNRMYRETGAHALERTGGTATPRRSSKWIQVRERSKRNWGRRTAQGLCAWGKNPTGAFTGALGHRRGQDRLTGSHRAEDRLLHQTTSNGT